MTGGRLRETNLREAHGRLYSSIMTLAVMSIALAVNFWTSNPTFNPYGIPKDLIGVVFLLLGISHLVFLNWLRDQRKLRYGLTASLSFMLFWGISNTEQSFAGKASFQLPIMYVALAMLHLPLLVQLLRIERE